MCVDGHIQKHHGEQVQSGTGSSFHGAGELLVGGHGVGSCHLSGAFFLLFGGKKKKILSSPPKALRRKACYLLLCLKEDSSFLLKAPRWYTTQTNQVLETQAVLTPLDEDLNLGGTPPPMLSLRSVASSISFRLSLRIVNLRHGENNFVSLLGGKCVYLYQDNMHTNNQAEKLL